MEENKFKTFDEFQDKKEVSESNEEKFKTFDAFSESFNMNKKQHEKFYDAVVSIIQKEEGMNQEDMFDALQTIAKELKAGVHESTDAIDEKKVTGNLLTAGRILHKQLLPIAGKVPGKDGQDLINGINEVIDIIEKVWNGK